MLIGGLFWSSLSLSSLPSSNKNIGKDNNSNSQTTNLATMHIRIASMLSIGNWKWQLEVAEWEYPIVIFARQGDHHQIMRNYPH